MPGKSTAVELCWLGVFLCLVEPRELDSAAQGLDALFRRAHLNSRALNLVEAASISRRFRHWDICRVITENYLNYFCGRQLRACHFDRGNFAGQHSPELCNPLPVFMATSGDLKGSDCHNELVASWKKRRQNQCCIGKSSEISNQDMACYQLP